MSCAGRPSGKLSGRELPLAARADPPGLLLNPRGPSVPWQRSKDVVSAGNAPDVSQLSI